MEMLEAAGNAFAQEYEDANVTIEVKMFDYVDEESVVTGGFDTKNAVDILYESYFNMASYIHTGRVVPLDDVITSDLRGDIDEEMWEISSTDGKTYMMPYQSMQNVIIYNKSLMKECGLENYISDEQTIQNWTVEQWTEILDTMAEKLPSGCYPMFMYGKNNQGDTHIMSLIRAFGSTIYDEEDNFAFENEKAVEALQWIQDGVDKGWYPPHAENLEITDNQELFYNNQLGFYIYNIANRGLVDNLEDYGFVNFPGNVATSFITGFEIFDNGNDAKIKVAKDFLTYIYENDTWLDLSAGNIPVSKKVGEKYGDQIEMLNAFLDNTPQVVDFMNNCPNWQGNDTSVRSVFWPNIHALLRKQVTAQECAANLDADCNEAIGIGREGSVLHE
jgi:multiple sugar transport system substrate-binding protein